MLLKSPGLQGTMGLLLTPGCRDDGVKFLVVMSWGVEGGRHFFFSVTGELKPATKTITNCPSMF